ncbi:MAG TPA: methyltransferase domain-containing protein [Mycobacterium sp.]
MTNPTVSADHGQVAAKHRAMWAAGDYATVVAELISSLGPVLVEATGIGPGDRVLDIAAGTGNVSIPAAATGARVIASDLCPELMEHGRKIAEERGIDLEWREANAHDLPFEDDEFDVVTSCLGVMFAPFHQVAADELVRVCKPGGRIGLISWTPEGLIGQLWAAMKPCAPSPPPGAQPPPLWGQEDHVRALLGDGVTDVVTERRTVTIDHFADGAGFRDYFKEMYGPTIAVYRNIEGDPERVAALDAEIAGLGDGLLGASSTMEWEYLLLTARKA